MIKFLDLKKINVRFNNELADRFNSFLNSGSYILGSEVLNFESECKDYCGTKYCIGTSNGLDALRLIFEAYKLLDKVNEGDEVIVPANTYIASVLSISNAKLVPVLIEPDPVTFNIDVNKIEQAITKRTKAILGVHLYGQLYNAQGLEKLCEAYNLVLIEDAAQAHGATLGDGRKAGNLSDAAAFSFYPTKNLGALGDGGAITTNNGELAEVLFKLRNYGRVSSSINDIKGFNCRLDELQAAFLRLKLKYLDSDNQARRGIAVKYKASINNDLIALPQFDDINAHVFHLFVIKCDKRNELKKYLFDNGVETLIHYPKAIHNQQAYLELSHLNLPITDKLHKQILSIPLHQMLEEKEVEKIIYLLSNFK